MLKGVPKKCPLVNEVYFASLYYEMKLTLSEFVIQCGYFEYNLCSEDIIFSEVLRRLLSSSSSHYLFYNYIILT